MNRYTRTSASSFTPMSMEEIFKVPLAKQAQHDSILSTADTLGVFNVNALEQDKELRDSYISKYNEDLEGLTNEVMSSGINNQSKRQLTSLAKKRKEWLTKGDGKNIEDNYKQYVANVEDVKKMYETGKISADKYQQGVGNALSSYKGVSEKDRYNAFVPIADSNYQERAQKIASEIKNNPIKITEFTGLQYDPRTGKYLDIKTDREYTEQGAIQQYVKAALLMDPEVTSDLLQRQQLGILGDRSAEDVIDGIALLNEGLYTKDNISITKQYTGIDQGQLDLNNPNVSNRQFEYGSDITIPLRNKQFSNRLKKIANGENFSTSGLPSKVKLDEWGVPTYPEGVETGNTPATYDNLKPKEKQEYDILYSKLQERGAISKTAKKDSPEVAGAISNYLDTTQEFKYQDIKYTDGLAQTYSGRNAKFKQTTPKNMASGIAANIKDRWIYDLDSGERIEFDDLSDAHKEDLLQNKARVSSVYSPRNMLAERIESDVKDRVLVSPYELSLSDGKKILVSRSESEMQEPSYKVAQQYNKIWRDINKFPNVSHEYVLPGVGKTKIIKNFDGSITAIESDGTVIPFENDDEFENTLNTLYQIK